MNRRTMAVPGRRSLLAAVAVAGLAVALTASGVAAAGTQPTLSVAVPATVNTGSPAVSFAGTLTDPAGGTAYPATTYAVTITGDAGLTASEVNLQYKDDASTAYSDVALVDNTDGSISGTFGATGGEDLAPGGTINSSYHLSVDAGAPTGNATVQVDAVSGGASYATDARQLTIAGPAATTTLTTSQNPIPHGGSVTLTATVSPSDATGSVTFKDGMTSLGTSGLVSGSASFPANNLADGPHKLTAVYSGDTTYSGSVSNAVNEVVTGTALPSVVAVRGTDGAMWVRQSSGGGFRTYGGQIATAPRVVNANGVTYYVATSSSGSIYVRTDVRGWTAMGPSGTSCTGIDVVKALDRNLLVSCTKSDHAVYFGKAPIKTGVNPVIASFASLGGRVSSAAAVWIDGAGAVHLSAVVDNATLWTRTLTTGWTNDVLGCSDAPTILSVGGVTYTVCRSSSSGALVYRVGNTIGATGAIIGRIGLVRASTDHQTLTVFVEGTNGAVYAGPLTTAGMTSLVNYGGKAVGGAGADSIGN